MVVREGFPKEIYKVFRSKVGGRGKSNLGRGKESQKIPSAVESQEHAVVRVQRVRRAII